MLLKKSSLDLNSSEVSIMMGADAKILTALTSPKTSPLHNARAHSFGSISCHPADTRTRVSESTWDSEHRSSVLEMLEEKPRVDGNLGLMKM